MVKSSHLQISNPIQFQIRIDERSRDKKQRELEGRGEVGEDSKKRGHIGENSKGTNGRMWMDRKNGSALEFRRTESRSEQDES
ncbi:unnamed protein product [Anisakis simplex]|uniref:Uncharacterized protein n=1 Tax=Anisakis simplex TaxID=6269 RepID=A0A0M3JK89_ANISI|nr:unnamed protein product [Anisakis simplex]